MIRAPYKNTVWPVRIFFSSVTMSLWLPKWTRVHLCFPAWDFRSQHEMVVNPPLFLPALFLDTNPGIERSILSLTGSTLWIHIYCVMYALWPLGLLPAPSPGILSSYISLCSQPQVCLSAAFYSKLHWWAVPCVIPVLLSLLLSSGSCLFLNFLQALRWVEKGKGQISNTGWC